MEVLRQEALQGFPIVGEYTISIIATMRGWVHTFGNESYIFHEIMRVLRKRGSGRGGGFGMEGWTSGKGSPDTEALGVEGLLLGNSAWMRVKTFGCTEKGLRVQ